MPVAAPPITVEVVAGAEDPAPAIAAWARLLLSLVEADGADAGDGD